MATFSIGNNAMCILTIDLFCENATLDIGLLLLQPILLDVGCLQICPNTEEDTEGEARHATGEMKNSIFHFFTCSLSFQLYVLKLLKMQTKYLGRQWRKSNMKTMSAIYTKVRETI